MSRHHPDPASRRQTQQGDVTGFAFTPDTLAWWGIPYAQPPVGPLRWRAPRPHAPWSDARPCLRYGAMSLQLKSFMTNSPPAQWNKPIGSEDCLTLNIFSPRNASQGSLPVMVWIHGGGNTGGASSLYTFAGNLAQHNNVVIVTVNYRLGVFGWFLHPALFDEDCSAEDRSGNYGTLDLIAALRWVRDNIANFGGDPGNVTIFGESAGGQNVLSLYVSPQARGLFHKAIAQSPISHTVTMESGYLPHAQDGMRGNSMEVLSRLWVAEGRADNHASAMKQLENTPATVIRDYLYHKDAEQILSMFNGASAGIFESPRLFRDGVVLPDCSMLDALADPQRHCGVPLLIGSNRDEMKLFMMMSPAYVSMRFGKVPVMRNQRRYVLDADYRSLMWKALGVDEPLHRLYASGQKNLYCYRFDWDEIPAIPFIRPDILIGATHAMEIPFVMRDVEGRFNPLRTFTKRNRKSRVEVTLAMSAYWCEFARTGNPDGNGRPAWTNWQPGKTANTLVIDSEVDGGIRMENTEVTRDTIRQQLRQDKRLRNKARERCRLYAQLFLYGGMFDAEGTLEEYESFGDNGKAPVPAHTFKTHML